MPRGHEHISFEEDPCAMFGCKKDLFSHYNLILRKL